MLFVLSAPSGSGKTTIAHAILESFPQLAFSISATTRRKRPDETNGNDYFFLEKDEFERKIKNGEFVEWEEIFGNFYGTLKSEVDRILNVGHHMLFDIDVKGALSIKRHYPDQAILIFIKPPDLKTLQRRLEKRGTDSEEIITRRIKRAMWELDQAEIFDYVVVNDDLSRSIPKVAALIEKLSGIAPQDINTKTS